MLCVLRGRFLQGQVNVGRVEVPSNESLGKRFDVKVGADRKQIVLAKVLLKVHSFFCCHTAAAGASDETFGEPCFLLRLGSVAGRLSVLITRRLRRGKLMPLAPTSQE